ncbi:MAG: DUF4335 domain-containing protein, partial [Leptolyngbyaceae cyanobacterium SM2_5_2]|nr:DUF4335 domain-containing protein [Leptolyngbyaceae cyanobacterium SM2_5_2]
MTVKRQYTLPYCNLAVEGLSADINNPLSPVTLLMNAECRLPGVSDITLTGGRDFLDSLVMAVSRYGQQLLSGIPRPTASAQTSPPLVDLKPGDQHYHHLIVRQQSLEEPPTDTNVLAPLDIKLTTVQFYDLMEAVDQLLADTQTLPDLTAEFQAVPRRQVKPAEPVTKRAAPAALGAAALAAAGLALFFVPPPEFEPTRPDGETNAPAETTPAPVESGTEPQTGLEDSPAASPEAAEAEQPAVETAPVEAADQPSTIAGDERLGMRGLRMRGLGMRRLTSSQPPA